MRVLHACTEIYPLLKTGGLADVAAALPVALAAQGCAVRMLLPGFPALLAGVNDRTLVARLPPGFGVSNARLTLGRLASGIEAYLIETPTLYERPGNPYADAAGVDYADNHLRFALLGWVAMRLGQGIDADWRAEVVHCHDWHAGLAPAYLQAAARSSGSRVAGSVQTVHNLAYQGVFPASVFGELGLPADFFQTDGVEFYGDVSFLKAGLYYADRLTTVSPTYAREIQGREQGCGLDGLLTTRRDVLTGVLNGVDAAVWNSATDASLAARYRAGSMQGKATCRRALQTESGLTPQTTAPLFCVVSRLTGQKGLQLVLDAVPALLQRGGQLALLGSGDAALEAGFTALAAAHPESVSVTIGYDEDKAHRLIAGSDVILVPSHFEPCGLTQLYGLGYGTLPLVRRVGGLADSVTDSTLENLADDSATGFVFDAFTADAFDAALRRAFALYARPTEWQQVQQRGMRQSFSWGDAASALLTIYEQAAA